jgi:hypothetical protein
MAIGGPRFYSLVGNGKNLVALSKTLQLDLKLEAAEQNIGSFRADLICKERDSGKWVVIENQLEGSDHTHLGQILTYAAGFKAQTVIWIAKRFTEEHRAALDWLNSVTGPDIHFFAVEIQVWRIENSKPAPTFNIVVQPNDWSNQVAEASRKIEFEDLSNIKKLQFEYWTALNENLKKAGVIQAPTPQPLYYTIFPIGKSDMHLSTVVNSREKHIGVELYLDGSEAKKYFEELYSRKNIIEKEIGIELEWQDLPNKVSCRVLLRLKDTFFSNRDDWQRQHAWMMKYLEIFRRVFEPRVRDLAMRIAS